MFKRFLISQFHARGLTESDAERESVAYIDRLKGEQFPSTTAFFEMRDAIASWRALNRIRQRKEAAQKRWVKEKSKRGVDPEKPGQK